MERNLFSERRQRMKELVRYIEKLQQRNEYGENAFTYIPWGLILGVGLPLLVLFSLVAWA